MPACLPACWKDTSASGNKSSVSLKALKKNFFFFFGKAHRFHVTHIPWVCVSRWLGQESSDLFFPTVQVWEKDQGSSDVGQKFQQVSWNLAGDLLMWNTHGQSDESKSKANLTLNMIFLCSWATHQARKFRGIRIWIPICYKIDNCFSSGFSSYST